jgi:hypothetical protein
MKLKCEKHMRNYGRALNLVLRSGFSFEPLPLYQDHPIISAKRYYLYTKYKKTKCFVVVLPCVSYDLWTSGVMTLGFLTTERLAISLTVVKYGTLGNSAASSKGVQMCVLLILP